MTHPRISWLTCLLLISLLAGCHRSWYRQRADAEVECLLRQKTNPVEWPLAGYNVYVDPRSRMFDPFDFDYPPMPPDDPASHQLMHCVDCKPGYPCWHVDGDISSVEGPDWQSSLPLTEDGVVALNVDSSVQLALLHSPRYQAAVEELYLSALDVSIQRFAFDAQFGLGYRSAFAIGGKNAPGSGGESSSKWELSTFSDRGGDSLVMSKMYASGGELLVGFANNLMWEFSGPDRHSGSTLIDFALVQPFLRGGGKNIAMEQLTQSERTLLANVRQLERFKQEFYVEVVAGRTASNAVNRNLVALSGILNGFSNTSFQAGGYLGLLQSLQDIRNQRSNIAQLQSSVAQLDAFFVAGRIDFFQVELARQALFSAQSRLINSERNLETALDVFKVTMGLPPYLEVTLDDELIAPFQLVDPSIVPLQNLLTVLQQQVGQTMSEIFNQAQLPAMAPPGEPIEEGSPEDVQGAADLADLDNVLNQDAVTEPNQLAQPAVDAESGLPTVVAPEVLQSARPQLPWSDSRENELTELRRQLGRIKSGLLAARAKHVPAAREDVQALRSALADRKDAADRLREQIKLRLEDEVTERGLEEVSDQDIEGLLPYDYEQLRELPAILDQTIAIVLRELAKIEKSLDNIDGKLETIMDEGPRLDAADLVRPPAGRDPHFYSEPIEQPGGHGTQPDSRPSPRPYGKRNLAQH